MKKKFSTLFKNLCCSQCKADFDENSVQIVREEDQMMVIRLVCEHCGKSFGVAFVGISDIELKDDKDMALEIKEGCAPIGVDDVLDAHKFIKNLDENWSKHLPKG